MDSQKTTASVSDMENEDDKFKFVTGFQVKSGMLVIGDPLLDGNRIIDNVANGEWCADVIKSKCGKYNTELFIYLVEDELRETDGEFTYVEDIVVDTGTMGIFCDSAYDESGWFGDFDILADMLDNEDRAGGAPGGVACKSGYGDGDGTYFASVCRDLGGQVVSVCVYFIDEDEASEDDGLCETCRAEVGEDLPKVNVKDSSLKELN